MLELAAPRYRAAGHHGNEAGAGAAVNSIGKGGILPDEEVGADVGAEGDAVVLCPGDIAEDTLGLLSVPSGGRAHVAAEEADSCSYVRACHVRKVQELAGEGGEREGLDVERGITEVGR